MNIPREFLCKIIFWIVFWVALTGAGSQRFESEEMSLARNRPRYAARLNAFKSIINDRPDLKNLIGAAADVEGLDAADLNYPDHFDGYDDTAITSILNNAGMALNGVAVRYYSYPEFRLGAFTNPDPAFDGRRLSPSAQLTEPQNLVT